MRGNPGLCRGGFLIRTFLIALALGMSGAVLSTLEERFPEIRSIVPEVLFPSQADPQVAQAVLTSIATSTMTVVSIVFAILLMTLTLASTQFSPRILISFVRDHVTQWTLGIFLGTFSYCIAALPAARSLPAPFAPVVTVVGAMALAPVCVGWLIYFIHHISNAISVNHIVDRIRRETELVVDELMPYPRRPTHWDEAFGTSLEDLIYVVESRQSGYIRFVDIERLRALAKLYGVCLKLERRVGQFIPTGVALLRTTRGNRLSEERALELLAAIDVGPAPHHAAGRRIRDRANRRYRVAGPSVHQPASRGREGQWARNRNGRPTVKTQSGTAGFDLLRPFEVRAMNGRYAGECGRRLTGGIAPGTTSRRVDRSACVIWPSRVAPKADAVAFPARSTQPYGWCRCSFQ
jgi:hypothetical protein